MPNISARPEYRTENSRTRSDPESRPTTGGFEGLRLLNKDPGKEYVLVNTNTKDTYYEYLNNGYRPVVSVEGGPSFVAGTTVQLGEPIEMRGCVLMEIDAETAGARREDGLREAENRMAAFRSKKILKSIGNDYGRTVGSGSIVDGEINIPTRRNTSNGG